MKRLKNKLISIFAICILSILGFLVYEIFFSNEQVVVNQLVINNEKVPTDYRIVIGVISDIKYQPFMNKNRLEKFITKLNEQNVDVVLFLGDAIGKSIDEEDQRDLGELLKKIQAKKGKFFVLGDQDDNEIVPQLFDQANFEQLDNKHTKLYMQNQYINLIGLPLVYNNEIFKDFQDTNFTLAMAHYPELVTQLPSNIDYMVAGHTLGKQLNIPIFSEFKAIANSGGYHAGAYTVSANTSLYVNMGLGTVNSDIRFLAPPEITILTIQGK